MNFVLNIDPEREPAGEIVGRLVVGDQAYEVDADLLYVERRYDRHTGITYACLVFSLGEVE